MKKENKKESLEISNESLLEGLQEANNSGYATITKEIVMVKRMLELLKPEDILNDYLKNLAQDLDRLEKSLDKNLRHKEMIAKLFELIQTKDGRESVEVLFKILSVR